MAIPTAGVRSLAKAYKLDGPAHVLIRPDGYIAHITTGDWECALMRTLEAIAPIGAAEARQ